MPLNTQNTQYAGYQPLGSVTRGNRETAWGSYGISSARVNPNELTITRIPGETSLGMRFVNLRLMEIQEGSSADRCGAHAFIGKRLTHINESPIQDHDDIGRLSNGVRQGRFLFTDASPSPMRSRSNVNTTSLQQLEDDTITVVVKRKTKDVPLGIDLGFGLTLEEVDDGSPAQVYGLRSLIGHQVTHVGGQYVLTAEDVVLASQGLTSIEFRFRKEIFGAILRRSSPTQSWGFDVSGVNMELQGVKPNTPSQRAELGRFIGHQVTHINNNFLRTPNDLIEAMKGNYHEIELRFCPWAVQDLHRHPAGMLEKKEVQIQLYPGIGIGMALSDLMILEDIQPGSPADEAQIADFLGWKLTHINSQPVHNISDVVAVTTGLSSCWVRFCEVKKDVVVSPHEIAQNNENLQKYQAWLKKRSADRERAGRSAHVSAPYLRGGIIPSSVFVSPSGKY
eukprot:TRINITY_DN8961_c3_g2_i1.p1 TRINITY_DN8961_c3_g2~~TRINITY_DN8961_c3_g2_i1.p1  ORF type:complete len:451 (+),score=61.34 TRINITY_DN8961_c3_g2_i1:24-1376(+)